MSSVPPPPPSRAAPRSGRTAKVVGNTLTITNADGSTTPIDITGAEIDTTNSGKTIYTIKTDTTKPYINNEEKYIINTDGSYQKSITTNQVKPSPQPSTLDEVGINYTIPDTSLETSENQDLLEIFDKGINDIILRLKARFGKDNQEVNQVVSAISQILTGIDTIIDVESNAPDDYQTSNLITKKDPNTGKYTSQIEDGKKHIEYDPTKAKTQFDQIQTLKTAAPTLFTSLNTDLGTNYQVLQSTDLSDELNLNNVNDITRLNRRLTNCQALEISYLDANEILHSVGAFTKTLFEKYMYVTNVMLYLLKNLVNKPKLTNKEMLDSGCAGANQQTVRLPKEIIKNIAQLIAEQSKLKDSINTIDAGLSQTNMNNMYKFANLAIESDLKDINTPSAPSVPGPPHSIATAGNISLTPPVTKPANTPIAYT